MAIKEQEEALLVDSFLTKAVDCLTVLVQKLPDRRPSSSSEEAFPWSCVLAQDDTSTTAVARAKRTVLQLQQSILSTVVQEYNNNESGVVTETQLQMALRSSSNNPKKQALEDLEDCARQAICQLALYYSCSVSPLHSQEESSSNERLISEYWTMLDTSLASLTNVREFVAQDRQELFAAATGGSRAAEEGEHNESSSSAQWFATSEDRLKWVHSQVARSLGVDSSFLQQNSASPLQETYQRTLRAFRDGVLATKHPMMYSSDQHEQGGVTRVVSVQHREVTLVGNNHDDSIVVPTISAAPAHQSMGMRREEDSSSSTIKNNEIEQRVASIQALEDRLLQDLLSLPKEDRTVQLKLAKDLSDRFVQQLSSLPTQQERLAFMMAQRQEQSEDEQRLLLIHKIWLRYQQQKGAPNNE